jgi:hypothetical protein
VLFDRLILFAILSKFFSRKPREESSDTPRLRPTPRVEFCARRGALSPGTPGFFNCKLSAHSQMNSGCWRVDQRTTQRRCGRRIHARTPYQQPAPEGGHVHENGQEYTAIEQKS